MDTRLSLATICIVLFIGCLAPTHVEAADPVITVGSFNIRFFGTPGPHARSEDEIEQLAEYIKEFDCDVLCCQEINKDEDANRNGKRDWIELLDALGNDYRGWWGTTGDSQRLAFIWRRDRVRMRDLGEVKDIRRKGPGKKTFPRIPLTAYVESLDGGLDFRLITVHLYWGSNAARFREARRLNEWAKALSASDDDAQLLIIGDFNTKPLGDGESGNSKTARNLVKDGHLVWISKDHGEFTTPDSEERYDHGFMSPSLASQYVDGSWDVLREMFFSDGLTTNKYKSFVSDHMPVRVQFKDIDADDEPAGDWGKPRSTENDN